MSKQYKQVDRVRKENMDLMIVELMKVNNINWIIPSDEDSVEELFKTLMTISAPSNLSDRYYKLEEIYLEEKMRKKEIVDIYDINEELMNNIFIAKRDITTIKADAIVNAANEKMLGCFIPGHKCIDNAIHMSSGLRLRNACYSLMKEQGHDEQVGEAKITKGYNLPSNYVIHTVGPNVNADKAITIENIKKQLKKCYVSILTEADKYEEIENIVFCSISTGVYGVPIELASQVALITINDFLKNQSHHIKRVVIDVFSQEDYDEYKKQAKRISKKS